MHSQLKMLYLIQPNFIIVLTVFFFQLTMTDFSVEMTELSSVQLCIWRKRKMTVPSWRGKSTQEACDLRVEIFGYRQGSEVRGVWQTNTCYWGTKKDKKKRQAVWICSYQGQSRILGQQIMLVFTRHRVQPQRCGWHPAPTEISAPHTTSASCSPGGRHSREHVPTANPLCERGRGIKQREALLEAGIWIRNRDAGVMQTVLRELLIKRTSSKIKTVCHISVKNKTITNAIIFFHVSLVK